jgi:hypothetical protein
VSGGEVVWEEEESLRVLGRMDEAREMAGIVFNPKLEEGECKTYDIREWSVLAFWA